MSAGPLGARHPEVDRLRRLLRRRSDRVRERAFVIEGPKLLAEALAAGADVDAVYAPDGVEVDLDIDVPVRRLQVGVLERVADTVTPQPLLAVVRSIDRSLDDLVPLSFVVVCVDLQDPGNAGTVLRSAEASGAGAVVFAGASVDPFNPKAVRASAGSLFHVGVVIGGEAVAMLEGLRDRGLARFGAVARGGGNADDVDLTRPVALVFGNEAHGLPREAGAVLDGFLSIPIAGRSESLNVGMAASVLCFEVARQRRGTP